MSRIGKLPVEVPSSVKVNLTGQFLEVNGPKGKLDFTFAEDVTLTHEGNQIMVKPVSGTRRARSLWGLSRSLVRNMVQGVSVGFNTNLDMTGVGFKAASDKGMLTLTLGFSHEIKYIVPEGIEIKTPKPTEIEIYGFDKQKVGQVASEIRSLRKPEPYKGKGIRYRNEVIRRKEGKKK